jgi:lipid-binding SYLF domain-containing protein
MRSTNWTIIAATVACLGLAGLGHAAGPASGSTSGGADRAAIDREVRAAIAALEASDPAAAALARRAEAVLVFPSVTQAGFGIGGQYGTGAMLEGGRTVGHYNIVGGSFGWQIGAQSFSQAYIFNTAEAVETFRKNRGFEVGVGLTAVAADFGAQGEVSSSTLQAPLVVVTWGQSGLMAGATIDGLKISEIEP